MSKHDKPTRRDFLKTTGMIAAGSAAGMVGTAAHAAPKTCDNNSRSPAHSKNPCARPNILFMMVDEMRYPPVYEAAGLQQFRQDYLHTQNVLRETGVEFHRHYAASTACAPSRTSIFTGQYPSLHGVTQTTGAAKEANDPDVFWLDPAGAPTMGDYFKAAGYQTLYRGKWHVSNADLQIPGTHDQIVSYTDTGARDPDTEALYQEANRLSGYGFDGWIGPEPHGKAPLNTGSSPQSPLQGRDQGFADQTVELIQHLDDSNSKAPWFMVSSFVNPHDISLWGFVARLTGLFDFSVEDVVPAFSELFNEAEFARTLTDDLLTKPSCQKSYRDSYSEWMQGIPPEDYFRFYYQLHKNVDAEMLKVYEALQNSRFFDNTIVVFTSDHGDLLGSHRYMHQKWYQTYDEALRVPLIISSPGDLQKASVSSLTSHVDLLPTLLGLANYQPADLLEDVAVGHTDAVLPVGRDLSGLVTGKQEFVEDPIFFMTDDDPSRGENQDNFYGVAYDSVIQPNHIETVMAEIDGDIFKYSRYFDNEQFWTTPEPTATSPANDVVLSVEEGPNIPGVHDVDATKRVKYFAVTEEYEMYNVTRDPLELNNLANDPVFLPRRQLMADLLDEQREMKRLRPISGDVPGQP